MWFKSRSNPAPKKFWSNFSSKFSRIFFPNLLQKINIVLSTFFVRCSACNCEFSDAQHRVAHINVSHPKVMQKEAWTPCSKCHMRFPRKDVLRDHVKRVHQGGKSRWVVILREINYTFKMIFFLRKSWIHAIF